MFKSKCRPILIPQAEHGKLAGTLALLWGNADFDRPRLDFLSFVAGVGLHDRGYGLVDTLAIGETPEVDWLAVTRAGFSMPYSDQAADLIVRLHLRRLTGWADSPGRQALLAEMEPVIQAQIARSGLPAESWQRIDRLTDFCDRVAFDFCFEQPASGSQAVFPRNGRDEEVSLHYTIAGETIQVEPWPFAVETYTGYLVGYHLENYPAVLDPVVVPFRLSRA